MTEERWYSMREICKYLGVSNDTVAIWIRDKNFPGEKEGYYWKFKLSEVERWRETEDAANTRAYRRPEGIEAMPIPNPPTSVEPEPKRTVVSYKPLFKMLIDLGLKKKDLAELADISIATITKMGKMGSHVNTDVLDRICLALDCKIGDVIELVQVTDRELVAEEKQLDEMPVELNLSACEEYGLTESEREIVHFIYEQLQYYRDNPPQYLTDQIRKDQGIESFEEAKRNIPTDRFYSLVFNEVIEKWGYEGCQFNKKQISFKMIESGYFEAEEQTFGEMRME